VFILKEMLFLEVENFNHDFSLQILIQNYFERK